MLSPADRRSGIRGGLALVKAVSRQAGAFDLGVKSLLKWCYRNEFLPDWKWKPYLLTPVHGDM